MADGKLLAGNYEIIHLTVHRFKKANDQKQYPLNQQIALKPGLLKPSIPQKANLKWSAILLQAMGSNPKQFPCNHSATFPVIFFFRFVCVVKGSSDDVHAIIFIIPDYEYSCLWLIMLYNSCRVYILTSQTVFESEECTKWRLEVSDSSKSRNIWLRLSKSRKTVTEHLHSFLSSSNIWL